MKKISIGIDFAKEKFDATFLSAVDGRTFHGEYPNTTEGFGQLVAAVKSFAGGVPRKDWLFCGEHTGCYSMMLSAYLARKGYFMWLENPYVVKRCSGLQRGKSDKADSAMIADYAMRHADKAVRYERPGEVLESARLLLMQRDNYVRNRKSVANSLSEIPKDARMGEALGTARKSNRKLLEALDEAIAEMEREIEKLLRRDEKIARNNTILQSFPGVGPINAAALIIFTSNFEKFGYNARKIATYWGVAPFGKESGTSVHVRPHVSGFCNHWLKALFSNAANVAIRYCKPIRDYYLRLKAKGKCEGIARNNVKNKMLQILTAMVRDGKMFELGFQYPYKRNE